MFSYRVVARPATAPAVEIVLPRNYAQVRSGRVGQPPPDRRVTAFAGESNMSDVWVVVASSTRCRIFAQHKHNAPLEQLEEIEHPEGRLHDRDLATDRPGRSFDSSGPGRHGMGQPVSPSEQENIRFAKSVASRLDAARKREAFDRLVLVADPRFLGHLRQGLTPATRSRLSTELQKNLADADPATIREALPYRI